MRWVGVLACASAVMPGVGCGEGYEDVGDHLPDQGGEALRDDPVRYIEDQGYRRAILERDLVSTDNRYAEQRLEEYAVAGGWDELPERDWPSLPMTRAVGEQFRATGILAFDGSEATTLVPEEVPETHAEWIALGERVFFEYPITAQETLPELVVRDVLEDVGYLVHDERYLGLRLAEINGKARLTTTCAGCHSSMDAQGVPSGQMSNRNFDIGLARLIAYEHYGSAESPIDATDEADLAELGPGRSDVQRDDTFNPYAFPDFGGIADLPYLHHNANWHNRGRATLAIRLETVYITGNGGIDRIPRVLAWALAEYLYSLPPPPPLMDADSPMVARGEVVFAEQGCDGCHAPPSFTSDRLVPLDLVGTDSLAGDSEIRGTGYYRIPSLRGVGRAAPYLHHGAFDTLEEMFDPARDEPGHPFGLGLSPQDRDALLRFLRSI